MFVVFAIDRENHNMEKNEHQDIKSALNDFTICCSQYPEVSIEYKQDEQEQTWLESARRADPLGSLQS